MIDIDVEYDKESYCGSCHDKHPKYHIDFSGIKIGLCEDCYNELKDEIKDKDSIVFCEKCRYFRMSKYGLEYGGSCLCAKNYESNPTEDIITSIKESDYGYVNCKDATDTCKNAKRREGS